VLASEQQRDQQTHDLVVAQRGLVVLVGHIHEQLEQISALARISTFLYFVCIEILYQQ